MGLLLSVFTGKRNHPDGGVVEGTSLAEVCRERSLFGCGYCLDFTGVQRMVRDRLEVVRREQNYKDGRNREAIVSPKFIFYFFQAI